MASAYWRRKILRLYRVLTTININHITNNFKNNFLCQKRFRL